MMIESNSQSTLRIQNNTEIRNSSLFHRQAYVILPVILAIYVCLQCAVLVSRLLCVSDSPFNLSKAEYPQWLQFVVFGGVSCFLLNGIVMVINIMINFLSSDCPNHRALANVYFAKLTICLIAGSSLFLHFIYANDVGITIDYFGVPTSVFQWVEWLTTVPLLSYLGVAIGPRKNLDIFDTYACTSLALMIIFGALMSQSISATSYIGLYLGSSAFYFNAMRLHYAGYSKCALRDDETDENLSVAQNPELVLRQRILRKSNIQSRDLTGAFLWALAYFPIVYILGLSHLISPDCVLAMLVVGSVLAKLVFCALLTDPASELNSDFHTISEALIGKVRKDAEIETTEIRYVVSNFAHDLKTPLAGFFSGTEYNIILLRETLSLLDKHRDEVLNETYIRQTLNTILSHSREVTHINNFMMMTINRCIDYAKASKGIKLLPRFESCNVKKAFCIPLNCIKATQTRINIVLNPIPREVCNFVITDTQWLQENAFCLLSNAVKYSSVGDITIDVSLQPQEILNQWCAQGKSARENACTRMNCHRSPKESSKEENIENSTLEPDDAIFAPFEDIRVHRLLRYPEPIFSSASNMLNKVYDTIYDLCGVSPEREANEVIPHYDEEMSPLANHTESIISESEYSQNKETEDNVNKTSMYFVVEVADTGIGITDEVMSSLFSPFRQAQRMAGGTGLGLYSLSKRIDALNGYYGVRHRSDGKQGSVFWFAFDYRPDFEAEQFHAESLDVQSQAQQSISTKSNATSSINGAIPPAKKMSNFLHEDLTAINTTTDSVPLKLISIESAAATPRSHDSSDNSPPIVQNFTPKTRKNINDLTQNTSPSLNILLVEDSVMILKMVTLNLKRLGHTVTVAENGAIALELIQTLMRQQLYTTTNENEKRMWKSPFDLVLTDLQMPVMDGFEFVQRLRAFEKHFREKNGMLFSTNNVPTIDAIQHSKCTTPPLLREQNHQLVIGVSANSDIETLNAAMEDGMDGFLGKPLSMKDFRVLYDILVQKRSVCTTTTAPA